jgi:hypothetical protein
MFLIFSNRLGCAGTLIVSAVASLAFLWLLGFIRF